jgi:hypothetical protein
MKLPISFEQFSKDPWKAVQFLLLIVVGYLWLDNKMNYQSQIETHTSKIVLLETKMDKCLVQLKKSDSALAAATTKLEVLSVLGKIPK